MIIIHETAHVSKLAELEDSTRGSRIEIGPGSVVDSFVKFKPAGGSGSILVGRGVYINSGCVFYSGHGIIIGNDVLVAANCTFAATNHEYRDGSRAIRSQGFMPSRGGIRVGNDVWIGANSVILDGSRISDGVVIGAGSVVSGVLEPYEVYAGNPLRPIGTRNG